MYFFKLFLLVSISQIYSTDIGKWKTYDFEKHGFSIDLPQTPIEEESLDPTIFGNLNGLTIFCSANTPYGIDSNGLYMASCLELPDNIDLNQTEETLQNYYQAMIDNIVLSLDGRLLYERDIQLEAFEGKQIKILFSKKSLGGKMVSRVRIFLIKNQLFMIQTMTLPQYDNNSFIDKFMDSFKFIQKKEIEKKINKKL
jgi:hypothetical protein